jgi:hypothetical protein
VSAPRFIAAPCSAEPEPLDPVFAGKPAASITRVTARGKVSPKCRYIGRIGEGAVGSDGFKGPPNLAGEIEISYLTLPSEEGANVTTSLPALLMALPRAEGQQPCGIARMCCAPKDSTRVFEKAGFVPNGFGEDPEKGEVWRCSCPVLPRA